jgi:hypothetical protein
MSTHTVRLLYLNETAKVHRPIHLSPTTTSYTPSRLLQLFHCYTNENHSRLMRCPMLLQPFHFRIEAMKGKENVGADYLNRVYICYCCFYRRFEPKMCFQNLEALGSAG